MSKSLFVLLIFSTVLIMFSCQVGITPGNIDELENSDSPLITSDQERTTIFKSYMMTKQYDAFYDEGYNITNYIYIAPTYYYNDGTYHGTLPLAFYYVSSKTQIYGPIFLYTVQIFYEGYVSNN